MFGGRESRRCGGGARGAFGTSPGVQQRPTGQVDVPRLCRPGEPIFAMLVAGGIERGQAAFAGWLSVSLNYRASGLGAKVTARRCGPILDHRHRHRPLRGDRQGGDGWPAATAEPSAPRLLRLSQPTRL